MERRSFIKKTGIGIGGALLAPGAIASSVLPSLVNSQYVPLRENIGQIRHGLLQLPQAGYINNLISFRWLDDASRNIFFENGFQEGNKDMEIISLLIRDPQSSETDAMQIQKAEDDVIILREGVSHTISHAKYGFKQVPGKKLKDIKLEVGYLSGFKAVQRKVQKGTEVYLQMLEGHMMVNDISLEPGTGLCLSYMKDLQFQPTKACKFILLSHKS